MAKRHQQRPAKEHVGRNNPGKSTVITTGQPKKQETYEREAREHKDPGTLAQKAKVPPTRDMTPGVDHEADSQRRMFDREKRSGSYSNADTPRKDAELHDRDVVRQPEKPLRDGSHYMQDLEEMRRPNAGPALNKQAVKDYERSAYDIKELHDKLADLTDDEMKSIRILPEGSRLAQGGRYIDLRHLENGEFVARADMIAGPDNYYVSKQETGYVLWNRLNQVENRTRLDESQ
jgi:hypothetical protein